MTEISTQTARDDNVRAIVAYFESGAKPTSGTIGVELEYIIVKSDFAAVPYEAPHGIKWILESLCSRWPDTFSPSYTNDKGDILGLKTPCGAISLEPGGQIELSVEPLFNLNDIKACIDSFEDKLKNILDTQSMVALTYGYHPSARARDIKIIPKHRYELMDSYFRSLPSGSTGMQMMRCSASTQISIDYTSQDDALRKMRLAFAVSPLFALLCDNSPIYEGALRTQRLVRTAIWRGCDPARCKIVPGIMNPDFTFADYANYLLDAPAIVSSPTDTSAQPDERTFGEIFDVRVMSRDDIEHAISMFFTDVRLKNYIEFRCADAMSKPYALAYAALVKGLFSTKASLHALEACLGAVSEADITRAEDSLIENGYDGVIYGKAAADLADEIVLIARNGLAADEVHFLEPLESLIAQRTTLATQMLDEHKAKLDEQNAN